MPKKLNLHELKIRSFVTSLDNELQREARGGATAVSFCITNCSDETCNESIGECSIIRCTGDSGCSEYPMC